MLEAASVLAGTAGVGTTEAGGAAAALGSGVADTGAGTGAELCDGPLYKPALWLPVLEAALVLAGTAGVGTTGAGAVVGADFCAESS